MGLGLLCLMPLSTKFNYTVVVSFIGGGNWSTWKKSTDKLYNIMLYLVHLTMSGIPTHNFNGEQGTDCIGSCKSNYYTIMTPLSL